ncbi:hypothetical protein [Burkholderia sp. BCC1985]|uniref:hypothetical protein n=1 Tax=Burkholderia sp. BCC1985 TaxID=2817442 RepID=UPI002AAF71BB|nr:hypothetical protein [Burkholderia sp. BCC1985]
MSVLGTIIPGSNLGAMGPLGKFVALPDPYQTLYAAYLPGSAIGSLKTNAVTGAQYVRDKSGAGRHASLITPSGEVAVSATGYISGTTLTITAVAAGSLTQGQIVTGPGISANTMITANGTGTGGTGTYTVAISQTAGSSGAPIAISSATIGANSMMVDPAHYLQLPFSAQQVAAAGSGITVASIALVGTSGSNLPLLSDYGAQGAYIISDATTAGGSKAYTNDGTASATTGAAGGNLPASTLSMYATTHSAIASTAYWRKAGVGTGSYFANATKASGVVGGTSNLRIGHSYDTTASFSAPGQIFASLIYASVLSQSDLDTYVYPALQAIATSNGWGGF